MWYNELNFESNPLSLDREVELISYDDVIDEMLYVIESGNMLFIEAPDGHGKTSLLKIAINKYKGQRKVAYIDCNRLEHLNIENVIMKRYGIFRRLFSKTPKDMIILIDNINNLSKKNCERLKYFFDQNYIKSVVFAGVDYNSTYFTPSLKDRINRVIKLPELKNDDAIEIIEDRMGINNNLFPENIIKEIFLISNRNPKLFIQNCEKLAKYAVENYSRVVKQEYVNKVFNIKKEIPKQEIIQEQPKEELLTIKTKKETYKQKIEKEILEEAKDKKEIKELKKKRGRKKKSKREESQKIVDNKLEKSQQEIAEKYY